VLERPDFPVGHGHGCQVQVSLGHLRRQRCSCCSCRRRSAFGTVPRSNFQI
jgi:hypothetical protein